MSNPEDFKFFDGKWGKMLVRTNIRTVIKMSNNSIATISTLVLFLNNRLGSFKGRLLDTLIPHLFFFVLILVYCGKKQKVEAC